MKEKPPVPLRRWALWWVLLGAAVVVFYVVLTPVWLGLRAAAWAAELRARARARGERSARNRHEAVTDSSETPR